MILHMLKDIGVGCCVCICVGLIGRRSVCRLCVCVGLIGHRSVCRLCVCVGLIGDRSVCRLCVCVGLIGHRSVCRLCVCVGLIGHRWPLQLKLGPQHAISDVQDMHVRHVRKAFGTKQLEVHGTMPFKIPGRKAKDEKPINLHRAGQKTKARTMNTALRSANDSHQDKQWQCGIPADTCVDMRKMSYPYR